MSSDEYPRPFESTEKYYLRRLKEKKKRPVKILTREKIRKMMSPELEKGISHEMLLESEEKPEAGFKQALEEEPMKSFEKTANRIKLQELKSSMASLQDVERARQEPEHITIPPVTKVEYEAKIPVPEPQKPKSKEQIRAEVEESISKAPYGYNPRTGLPISQTEYKKSLREEERSFASSESAKERALAEKLFKAEQERAKAEARRAQLQEFSTRVARNLSKISVTPTSPETHEEKIQPYAEDFKEIPATASESRVRSEVLHESRESYANQKHGMIGEVTLDQTHGDLPENYNDVKTVDENVAERNSQSEKPFSEGGEGVTLESKDSKPEEWQFGSKEKYSFWLGGDRGKKEKQQKSEKLQSIKAKLGREEKHAETMLDKLRLEQLKEQDAEIQQYLKLKSLADKSLKQAERAEAKAEKSLRQQKELFFRATNKKERSEGKGKIKKAFVPKSEEFFGANPISNAEKRSKKSNASPL